MKNYLKKFALLGVCSALLFLVTACGGPILSQPTTTNGGNNNNSTSTKEDDKPNANKTQISVYSYDGGYGSDWLYSVKQKFEEEYKDTSFEEGKMGVQVLISPNKSAVTADSIKNDSYDIYFIEGNEDYHVLKAKNCFEDLTSIVKEVSKYDNKTIESKLTPEQQAYWGIEETDGVHYYCLPHYEGYYGIVYNVDLFDKKGFYFAEDKSDGDFILPGDNENKSAGPDGVKGTLDDGLPATYEEFYALCDYIKEQSIVPLLWTGEVYNQYVTSFTQSMMVDYEGVEQTILNYALKGTATDLGKIVNGEFVKDSAPTTITGSNGYELARQAGKYYATKFTEVITKTDKYHNPEAFSGLTQLSAQERFLRSSYGVGDGINDPCAMLIDGVWWENEAERVYTAMTQAFGEEASKNSRKFGWMYLPKATEAQVGSKNTLCDVMDSKCFVKAGLNEGKKTAALNFVLYVNSDECLKGFTLSTGAPKALQYTLTDEEVAKLSPYGQSLYKYRETADILYPRAQNEVYVNNATKFDRLTGLYNSLVSGKSLQTPAKGMKENSGVTAEQYFTGMYEASKAQKFWKDVE